MNAGISLRELSRRVDMNPGFVSQLENGAVGASVSTLYKIVDALDVPIATLFAPPAPARRRDEAPFHVLRRGEQQPKALGGGVSWALLATGKVPGVEFREILYEPGAESSAPGEMRSIAVMLSESSSKDS